MSRILPASVVKQIMYGLPVKSLMRLRCVSKTWDSLITDPSFTSSYHMNHEPGLLVCSYRKKQHTGKFFSSEDKFMSVVDEVDLPSMMLHMDEIGSINGVLCVLIKKKDKEKKIYYKVALFNPFTREYKVVRTSRKRAKCVKRTYGFGFDSESNDYMVVELPRLKKSRKVKIYGTRTGCWRISKAILPKQVARDFNDYGGVELNDVKYCWLIRMDRGSGSRLAVLTFNMREEVFTMTLVPSNIEKGSYTIFRFKESPALLYENTSPENNEVVESFDVWVMNEFDGREGSWSRAMTIEPRASPHALFPYYFLNDDELLFDNDLDENNAELLVYETGTSTWRQVCPQTARFMVDAYICKPSLVSFDGRILTPKPAITATENISV